MPNISLDDAELYYESDGDGCPLVFAHGGTSNHWHWFQQVAAFRDRYRCITYDARGFGRSTGAPHVSGRDGHADVLLAVVDALGLDRVVLVGHSMGGYAVSGLAQRHPERVRGLAMIDTPFGFATDALRTWASAMIQRLSEGFDVTTRIEAAAFAQRRPDLVFLTELMARANPPRPAVRGLDAYEEMYATPAGDYRDFIVPTLFVVGAHDTLTYPWLIQATSEAVPGSQMVTIADCGHSPFYEKPTVFNAVLRNWLADLSLE